MISDPITIRGNQYTLPLLNEYVILVDSTRFISGPRVANSTTLTSTAGSDRGMLAGARIEGIIGSTGQNITFVRQIWNGAAWATVADTTEINGSQTVTASTDIPFRWVPTTPDWRMYILAGATAPTTIVTEFVIVTHDRAAVS